jgi:predicted type IV restriction endonuclease
LRGNKTNNGNTEDIVKAFREGIITMERMTTLVEEAELRAWVINQVNAMDIAELARMIEFIKTI